MKRRVADIKALVDQGLYTVNASKVAEAMIWRFGLGYDRAPGQHWNCLLPPPRPNRSTSYLHN